MKIRPLSRGTLITLVTSPGRHPVSPSRLKCNHGVEDNTPGKKCHPGRNLPSLEVAKVRRREKRTMIAPDSSHGMSCCINKKAFFTGLVCRLLE